MADREKALAKNTLIISLGTFLPKLTSLITLPILTGYLTTSEYGTYDLINTLVSLFLPLVTLQIQSGAFRFLIDRRNNKEESDKVVTNIVAFIVPVSIVALIILYAALRNISPGIRLLICIYFFVDILVMAMQQIVRGFSNNKLYSASSIVRSVVDMLLVVLLVAFAGLGLEGVLISLSVATLSGLLLLLLRGGILKHINLSLVSKESLKELISYSWPLVPNSLSNWILSASDRLVITFFLGVEANAMYAVATKIPSLLGTVQSTFAFAWQENASLASKDDDVAEYYSHMYDNIFCILTGVMAMLIAVTPLLFIILIRGDYNEAYNQMPILFMGALFSCISSFMGGIYVAHKKTMSIGVTTVMAAGINLAIDLMLVNVIGIYAGSVSTLAAYLFLTVERMIGVKKFQKITYNVRKIVLYLMLLLLMCVMCWINNVVSNLFNFIVGFTFAFLANKNTVFAIIKYLKSRILHLK